MEKNYSQSLIETWQYGKEEAVRLGSSMLNPEHLLLGIIRNTECEAMQKLKELNVNTIDLKRAIEVNYKSSELALTNPEDVVDSKPISRIRLFMHSEAISLGSNEINTNHLLLAILKVPSNLLLVLDKFNLNYDLFRMTMEIGEWEMVQDEDGNDNDMDDDLPGDGMEFSNFDRYDEEPRSHRMRKRSKSKTPMLDQFGVDLTAAALEDKLDPVYGRETEINRITQILSRRRKNNPVLIGEPGVGKSAIIEALATKIVKKEVSHVLFDKKLIMLNMTSMVAGTIYRGQFEERMTDLIDELKACPDVILFIDEIHTIVGAGDTSGNFDAANILKPALARGEIQCIGSTTLDEYRKIERDGALERRFQKVIVESPTVEDTIQILQKVKGKYEDYHKVEYTDKAIEACVRLTDRYISDRAQPDKAIDALDEAGARVHTFKVSVPNKILELESELQKTRDQKMQSVKDQQFEVAAAYRDKEREIEMSVEQLKKQWMNDINDDKKVITEEEVAEVVAMISGVPVKRVAQTEGARLLEMGEALSGKIIGQDEAISKVVNAIHRNRAGLKDPNKPIGTFIFLGPTGVGKTQLAKILARYLFDTDDALIRIDMSEYMEKFAVSRLVGAPPGYVGYEEGGQLTERVRRKPYSVVLLDEIEKAHPDVFNILLQILDEGRLTDSSGRKIDFKNTILIMTSNIGSRQLSDFGVGVGFDTKARKDAYLENTKSVIENALKKTFSPEFINRIDDIVQFNTLTKDDICKIIDIELAGLYERVKDMGFTLKIEPSAKDFIVEKGFDPKFGARHLKRAIQRYVEDVLAEYILKADVSSENLITLEFDEKEGMKVSMSKI
ncbi:MAG: ATP-dependent Clp protease ATP-binding subunit [Bacteroidales bacterium]|nr:ATP-dependent Clp protease ATP-binding subunit [Bacteroidales bacterium]